MLTAESKLDITLARTLWYNIYRGMIIDDTGEYVATLRLIPAIPIDRDEVPEDAPEAVPYILAIVEDAAIDADELVTFETLVSDLLVARMAQPDFPPSFCQFVYPTPPKLMPEYQENNSPT